MISKLIIADLVLAIGNYIKAEIELNNSRNLGFRNNPEKMLELNKAHENLIHMFDKFVECISDYS